MLIWTFMFQILFNKFRSRSIRISGIKNIKKNIRTINNFIKLFPNSFRLTFEEDSVLYFLLGIQNVKFMKVFVFLLIVLSSIFLYFLKHFLKAWCSNIWAFTSSYSSKSVFKFFYLQQSLSFGQSFIKCFFYEI